MDLQMPLCDGLEATRQIRVLEKEKNWGISALFIVTGQDNPDDRASAVDAGAQEFFVKPLSLKELDRHMKQYFPAFTR
jgi:CheY-like chemotaxis protein